MISKEEFNRSMNNLDDHIPSQNQNSSLAETINPEYEINSSVEIILGFTDVLKETGLSESDKLRFLEIIERNTRRISELVKSKTY